jgi:hypothetical protein
MKYLDMSFGFLEMAIGAAALIFAFRAIFDNSGTRIKPNASPYFITSQSLLGVAFVARLANLLLRQPRAAFEMIEIILLFIAASAILVTLAIRYWRAYHCIQGK